MVFSADRLIYVCVCGKNVDFNSKKIGSLSVTETVSNTFANTKTDISTYRERYIKCNAIMAIPENVKLTNLCNTDY